MMNLTQITADVWINSKVEGLNTPLHLWDNVEAILRKNKQIMVHGRNLHKFNPQQLTATWIFNRGHLVIHTFPEQQYLAIFCTCVPTEEAQADAKALVKEIIKKIKPRGHKIAVFTAGCVE